MRFLKPLLATAVTIIVVILLSRPISILPPLGTVLDPVNGAMANAEADSADFNRKQSLPGLTAPVAVWFEDRLVPHIRAANDHDLYYVQGYVHAFFRLWQMDMQTRAAAGRVSEVAGRKALAFDRGQRRKGMGYAAEASLKAMESDPRTKAMLDAYRDGINAYIAQCSFARLPVEYKLMDFRPEPWTNLRSALLLKYMADDLTGKVDDIPFTLLRDQLGEEQFNFLFPERIKGSIPVIPTGTPFAKPSLAVPPIPNASQATGNPISTNSKSGIQDAESPEGAIGSNNWAISGKHTMRGAPILCNDPHLGLNLPSLWYEVQLTAPGVNVYGVSLPGAPGIIIGFNDSLSWGVTNNYRDVKDYYEIKPLDAQHYQFDGKPTGYINRVEIIHAKDSADLIDTIRYTIHGPIQYEPSYPDPQSTGKTLAMCWMAHRGTNELLSIYLLNRAQNYDQYVQAIHHFECPSQNFVYADRIGNIAMWGQGLYINKWVGQGRFIMDGSTSSTLWGDVIPMAENPHIMNPAQGYLASANQITTDSTYPYWYNGTFHDFRAWEINEILSKNGMIAALPAHHVDNESRVTVDMGTMQNDNRSILAQYLYPLFLRHFNYNKAARIRPPDEKGGVPYYPNDKGEKYQPGWQLDANSKMATFFQLWSVELYRNIWEDDFTAEQVSPSRERTVQLLLTDTASVYFDDKRTDKVETINDILARSHEAMNDSLSSLTARSTQFEWYKVKNTSLTHLARIKAFSYDQLKIGGWSNTINAASSKWGPSWRMIVEMGKDSIEAYGVFPGGQSGNPGSRHYGDLIDYWTRGKYYKLLFLPAGTTSPVPEVKYTWTLNPA